MLNAKEIRRRGLEALAAALGPVDAVRFLQSFELGINDYTGMCAQRRGCSNEVEAWK